MTVPIQQKQELAFFNPDQVALIKNYLCKGITDDELKLFHAVCKKTGLDPFMKQIYAVKRKDQMTIQTSIDGYRLIAERSGKYCPGRESTYVYDGDRLLYATSYVKKMTADGAWHEVAASAYYDEYKPAYSNQFWESKKHIMLAKCAESLALRKAFPNELAGLYSEDEMKQADKEDKTIDGMQFSELNSLYELCSDEYRKEFDKWIKDKEYKNLAFLPEHQYERIKNVLTNKSKENQPKEDKSLYGQEAIDG